MILGRTQLVFAPKYEGASYADHLNRPGMMTDANQNVVWSATYEPFGAAHQITGPAANT